MSPRRSVGRVLLGEPSPGALVAFFLGLTVAARVAEDLESEILIILCHRRAVTVGYTGDIIYADTPSVDSGH